MAQHRERDPLVEGLLRLGKATDFWQPGDGGAATTRAQVIRHLRPQNRDAVSAIISSFRSATDAERLRAQASRAREAGARTTKDVASYHRRQSALRFLEACSARVREQDKAHDQLEAEVRLQLAVNLEEQARLTRLQQETQQLRERANFLAQLHGRSKRARPLLEQFTQHQRQTLNAVRARIHSETESDSDNMFQGRMEQLCAAVQHEVSAQLNTASKEAEASAACMSSSLMLTNGDQPMGMGPGMVFSGALAAPFPGGAPHFQSADMQQHLHLWPTSNLHRQIQLLMNAPPQKLMTAICSLAKQSRSNVAQLVGKSGLLADENRRCQAVGKCQAADPLFDVRMMEQAQVGSYLELLHLDNQLAAAKVKLLTLAKLPAVSQALAKPHVAARLMNEGMRAALAAARDTLDGLIHDADAQGQLVEEVGRLEADAFELERREQRLEGLVSLLTNSLHSVFTGWQQQHSTNTEFLARMMPKAYSDLAERCARSVDSLARGVAELLRVPPELLPVLAEQRRMQRLLQGPDGGGAAAAAAAAAAAMGRTGLPSPSSLSLVDRVRLTWPYVGTQRTAGLLRAAAASGCSAFAGVASTHGSLLIRSSVASTASSQGARSSTSDAVLLGACSVSGSVNASLNGVGAAAGGSGCWASGAAAAAGGGGGASAMNTMGSWPGPGGSRASGAAENLHGSGYGPGPGGGLAGSGSWLLGPGGGGGGSSSAPAIPWGPGPAALGLPTLCYWLATATALDPLAPFRCPAALLRELHERFQVHDQTAKWVASADTQLRSRRRDIAGLQPSILALREALETKRLTVTADRISRLARSRRDMIKAMQDGTPKVKQAMREMEEQGAVKLVPWRRVNGQTAQEILNEIRSLGARINQLQQQQPLQPHERPYGALMPPPARNGF
ncbi:hypothetical protein PLESTB_000830300 [Pleodorina starrii]|uniref:Uncharacterized protein n=1 Tax=Pleodorina starrii TaxID=330485 RepID=A0A9W6BKX5_9CHLO|nr:hypothetical protein PLESTM_000145700 [Pleodorina starrii]GLC54161.1 hypothetical protein PLESTB_000830300 [Pleodorina starrii]GLC64535.1 hypothetical protein PLESTF_000176300 [Pleodorina starrii]